MIASSLLLWYLMIMSIDAMNSVANADGDYLSKTLAVPTPQEWAEQIFFQQPKAHQLKHAGEHDGVEHNMDKLKLFFNGCHTRDVGNVTYQKFLKKSCGARRARLYKEKEKVSESGANKIVQPTQLFYL